MSDVTVTSIMNLQNEARFDEGHTILIDEPKGAGGDGTGPDPYSLLLAALGGCISMTVTMYARRKNWPLERVSVRLRQQRIHAKDCAECSDDTEGFVHRIERSMEFLGELSEEQILRLREIAHKCPVHKTLTSTIVVADLKE